VSLERLINAAGETVALADRLSERFALELAQVLRALERRLPPLIHDVTEGSSTAIVKASHANKARKALDDALTRAGYDDLAASAYGSRLDALTARVLDTRRLAQATARLSGAFDQRIAALKVLHESDLLDEGAAIARALWQATVRGVFGSRSVERILADLADIIDASEPQIATLYDTSVSIFGRQIEALQAGDDPDDAFLYAGPADKKTRPFCREHVGKVFSRGAIDALDNGQIDNVFLTGGGYNCRHVWMEVSKFSELQDYVDTGERIPEVEAQLKAA
jgi:hypothetical protein